MISIIPVSAAIIGVYWLRWIIWKRKDTPLVIPLLFTCLFLPKLNLMKVSGLSTAGIRTDDILALVLLIIAVRDKDTWKNRTIRVGVLILCILSGLNMLSVVSGRLQGYNNQILFSILSVIRKFEYFAFALVGIYAVKRVKRPWEAFVGEFTLMSILHAGLAMTQVLGKVSYAVSGVDMGDFFEGAAVSTFNGYYEYGQFLCFGCAIFICDFLQHRRWVSFGMLPVTLVMLVLSKSRSSLIIGALLILIAVYFPIRETVSRRKLAMGGGGILGALAVLILMAGGILGVEVVGRFSTVNLEEYSVYWKELIGRGDFGQYLSMEQEEIHVFDAMDIAGFLQKITDWSAAARFYKWGAVLDGFMRSPVLGYGTGVTKTMDGNYVKMLAETGIAGTAVWLAFYGWIMRTVRRRGRGTAGGRALYLMMVSILLGALVIDMFEASKPMEMMWLMVGAAIAVSQIKDLDGCSMGRVTQIGDLDTSSRI